MIILDSDILIHILRRTQKGKEWVEYFNDKTIALTSVSTFELFMGAEISQNRQNNLDAVTQLIQQFPVLPFNFQCSLIASKIYSKLKESRQLIDLNDIYIAAIVLEQECEIATENVKHFERIPGLKITKR